jgi:hypothetical protein
MAKEMEKKPADKGGEHKGGDKKPKHKLRAIHTSVADDGGFVHEHHYEDHKGNPMPPRLGGVSSDMEDLHQHMDDHLAPGGAQGDPQGAEDAEAQPAPAQAAGAGQDDGTGDPGDE